LEIFNQEYRVSKDKTGSKVLQIKTVPKDKDVVKVLSRLEKANADEKVREKLEDEEYLEMVYEEMYGEKDKEILDLKSIIEKQDQILHEKTIQLSEEKKRLREVAKLLKSLGLPMQEIADKTGLTISEIEGI
jgi:histidyl-tRNA synthetase